MQKMNPSVDDMKIKFYHHLWELKLCSSFVGILFRFFWGIKYFYPRTSFFPVTESFNFLFLPVIHQNTGKPTNMKQTRTTSINKLILYKFLFQIYTRIIPLVVFYSFWVQYNVYAPFTKIWFQKVVWDIENILQLPLTVPQLHNFLKEVQNETSETLPIRFPFFIILFCYWCILYYNYIILIILYSQYYLFYYLFVFSVLARHRKAKVILLRLPMPPLYNRVKIIVWGN